MIGDLGTSGPLPTLQTVMNFASRRHRLLLHNIANISTPGYRTKDVSVPAFQKQLAAAVEDRRERTGSAAGELHVKSTREVSVDAAGRLVLRPRAMSSNILFHDGATRDLEVEMQSLVENQTVYRMAGDFMKARFDLLRMAISERV